MDAAELARWTRFAAKGGIGRGIAIADCVAEAADDLMFLKVSFASLRSYSVADDGTHRVTRSQFSCSFLISRIFTLYAPPYANLMNTFGTEDV